MCQAVCETGREWFGSDNHSVIDQASLNPYPEPGAGGIKRKTEPLPSKSSKLLEEPDMRGEKNTQVLLGPDEREDQEDSKEGVLI